MRHKEHMLIDMLFLGKAFPEVHRYMDEPYKVFGSRHRMFRHDAVTALLLGLRHNDFRYTLSALLHIIFDRASSRGYVRGKR
jgi:hypothetical protein